LRKKYAVVAMALAAAMTITGCSLDDIKAKFVGTESSTSQVITGGSITVEDYDPQECVTLPEYKGVEVDCTVSDDDIQSEIDTLLSQNATTKKIKKGTAATGKTVNIDYVGRIKGKKFSGGSATDQTITLGSSGYVDGFDDGVCGMKVGEKKKVKVTFPDDYSANSSLAGKKAVFTVTLNYISKEITPDFDDAFVKENTDYTTVDEYKTKTKESLVSDKKSSAGSTALTSIMTDTTVVSLPETLKEAEKQNISDYTEYQISLYGMDLTSYLSMLGMSEDDYNTQLETYAEDNAKMLLVIEAIAAKENITCTEEDRQTALQETLDANSITEDEYRTQYTTVYGDTFSFEEFLRQSVLYDKVVQFLADNATIKE
jgi:trigger factor